MDTMTALATRHYPDMDAEAIAEVVYATMAYLLKTSEDSKNASNDLSTTIKEIGGNIAVPTRDYRSELYSDGYIIKNLKLWLWWSAAKRLKPRACMDAMHQFQVREVDWPLAKVTLTDRHLVRRLRSMAKTYKAHSVAEFDALVARAVEAADKAIRSHARTKLRFLEHTRFMSNDDLLMDLRVSAVLGLTRQYPKIDDDAHARNLAGLCARYGGDLLIKHHTHADRQFLEQNADRTWDSKVASVEDMPGNDITLDADVNDSDIASVVASVISRYQGRKRLFMTVMLGVENKEFSQYLAGVGLPENHILFDEASAADHDGDVLEEYGVSTKSELFDIYVGHAAAWLGVKERAAWKFLRDAIKDASS